MSQTIVLKKGKILRKYKLGLNTKLSPYYIILKRMSGKATKRFNNGGNKRGPKLEIILLRGKNFYNKAAIVDVPLQ